MKKKNKIDETTWSAYNYPDDGRGIAGDDDRPPGNILIGPKYKEIPFFNKLTSFSRNWDYDSGDWKWDHFEMANGQQDFDNYSKTVKSMEDLFPKKTWKNVWKRMSQVSDKETNKQFKQAGQPHRDASTQLGKGEDEIVAEIPKEIQVEELLKKIERLIL